MACKRQIVFDMMWHPWFCVAWLLVFSCLSAQAQSDTTATPATHPSESTVPAPEATASARGDESPELGLEYFETQVRPLLARRCYECHGAATGEDNGRLALDSVASLAAGGTRGPLIDRSDLAGSLLLQVVRYGDVELQMPPDSKLSAAELAILERWVLGGAPLPAYTAPPRPTTGDIDFAAGRQFWSFQPLTSVSLPPADGSPWARNAIDRFVLAQLTAHQLQPSPPADRATWLRRATFDVTGLPPTPAEVADYLADSSPDAAARVVDRLLASPRYGERWARVWLDLARYSDETPEWQSPTSAGWLYRDWVIGACNASLPYDQFVRLQLAADLLPSSDPADLAALGFLGLSPTYWKELKLAPAVIEQIVADEWDERIDAVSRTFLGLTVACARCHDHKFDPIASEDYYALAGIFASTQLDLRPLLPSPQAESVRDARRQVTELEARLKTLREQKSADADAVEQQIAALRSATPELDRLQAHVLREASLYVEPDGDDMTKLTYREREPRDLPLFRRGNPLNPGPIVPRGFLQVFSPDERLRFNQGSGRAELAEAILHNARGLAARVIVNRTWDQYFKAGLVRTPSDFGSQGELPSHPELLEFLASQWVAHDWDLKWLHRQILLSATYQQSSGYRVDAYALDPDNRWLWRMNRRRLEIEMWRDATLAVSDSLDLTTGGPSLPIDETANHRRTVYVRVAREELHPMLRMHDFPEANSHSPRREPTVTALQQLFVLNSPWLEFHAERLWQRLQPLPSDRARIDASYQLLFARSPAEHESELAAQYLTSAADAATSADEGTRWRNYLQALLGLNEFHFVD